MHIKKMVEHIVEQGEHEEMECLSEILIDLIYDLKHTDKTYYHELEYKLHKMAYGEHLTEDMAHKWVENMENKDGTKGAHWTIEQAKSHVGHHNLADFYAVLNMMYSDYYSPSFDTSTYVRLAEDWLNDPDVGAGKTLKYYYYVVH